MVECVVAIDATRVRFPDVAFCFAREDRGGRGGTGAKAFWLGEASHCSFPHGTFTRAARIYSLAFLCALYPRTYLATPHGFAAPHYLTSSTHVQHATKTAVAAKVSEEVLALTSSSLCAENSISFSISNSSVHFRFPIARRGERA